MLLPAIHRLFLRTLPQSTPHCWYRDLHNSKSLNTIYLNCTNNRQHLFRSRHSSPTESSVCRPIVTSPNAFDTMNTILNKLGGCFSTSSASGNHDTGGHWEGVVCHVDDLTTGELKEVSLEGDHKCLLIKEVNGSIHGLSTKCTHYGASLVNGSYQNGVIRCPWHGACFQVNTGDIEDFPGLDSLHKYEVTVDDEKNVKVRVPKALLGEKRRIKPLCQRDPKNPERIVILGGGGAAQACAETLRQDDNFTGELVVLTREEFLPYDRPKLSKAPNIDVEAIQLRNPAYYNLGDIDIKTGSNVTSLNTQDQALTLASGQVINYDKLVIASGTSPRRLDVPGADLGNIFVLRSPTDGKTIDKASRHKKVVIIGSSFIGMEVASYLADKAESVTVVGNSEYPFERSLGPEIGKMIRAMHEAKGVKFEMKRATTEFLGDPDGTVKAVKLEDATIIDADVVVLGVGVVPNNDFISEVSGLDLTEDGFVKVNEHLETSVKGVFAAGDIAAFPLFIRRNEQVHIGHWQLSHALGRAAALNVIGKNEPIRSVPFFWTVQFGKSIRYAGYAPDYDEIVMDGHPDEGTFVAYYCKDHVVEAIATLMRDPVAAQFADRLKLGLQLTKDQIQSNWQQSSETS